MAAATNSGSGLFKNLSTFDFGIKEYTSVASIWWQSERRQREASFGMKGESFDRALSKKTVIINTTTVYPA